MILSVVTTLYRSAPFIREFHRRMSDACRALTEDYEILFVNDGSPDESLEVALEVHRGDPRVRVIDFSRNFGHHKAILTGLSFARGDRVFLIDVDLEEQPELLEEFDRRLNETGADVVYGVQETRKGNIFERISGEVFYRVFNYLSNYPVPANIVTARLMSKRYVEALVAHRDREVFLAGIWAATGFQQVPVTIRKGSKGETTYTFSRKISIMVNSITSFSARPLVMIFYLGFSISLLAGLAAAYLVFRRLFLGTLAQGWPSLMVSIWLLGGLTLLCLGVIGIYLSKVFSETKPWPYTIVRKVYDHDEAGP